MARYGVAGEVMWGGDLFSGSVQGMAGGVRQDFVRQENVTQCETGFDKV